MRKRDNRRLLAGGRCQCFPDGINAWLTDLPRQHAYLLESTPPEVLAERIEERMLA